MCFGGTCLCPKDMLIPCCEYLKERKKNKEENNLSTKGKGLAIFVPSFPHYFLLNQPFLPKQILTYLLFQCLCICKLQSAF